MGPQSFNKQSEKGTNLQVYEMNVSEKGDHQFLFQMEGTTVPTKNHVSTQMVHHNNARAATCVLQLLGQSRRWCFVVKVNLNL